MTGKKSDVLVQKHLSTASCIKNIQTYQISWLAWTFKTVNLKDATYFANII
jgi:hypothetical protein